MQRKTPKGIWALRGVTIAIALIVVVVIGTVAYSAYQDYTAVRSELTGGSNQAQGRGVLNGNTYTVSINITVPNSGLYTLDVSISCDTVNPNISCSPAHVSVPGGQEQVLRFKMTVFDVKGYLASGDRTINGTVAIGLEPFANLNIGVDLSGYVQTGGP